MIYFIIWMVIGAIYQSYCLRKMNKSWKEGFDKIFNSSIGHIIPHHLLVLMFSFAVLVSVAVWPFGLFMRLFAGWAEADKD